MIKICIDAGHYGKYNRSPANRAYYESDMTWKLTNLQKKFLEEYDGIEVILTRSDKNKDKSLYDRGACSKGCDLFISNHSNAVGSYVDEKTDYIAIYHMVEDSTTIIDDKSKDVAKVLAPVIARIMGTKQGYKVLSRKIDYDRNGDGILNDNYYGVLHGARMVKTPGILIEHSFHTNTTATNWLLNDNNLTSLAKAEAETLANYFGLRKKTNSAEKLLFRVQTGAFASKSNADMLYSKIKAAGFDAYMIKVANLYKIQVGAFSVRDNAVKLADKMKAAGFDTYITTQSGSPINSTLKSIDEIAKEVIDGKWGNGEERKQALIKAGYNYDEVQKRVNKLL